MNDDTAQGLALIAAGWRQLPNGRWTHARFEQGSRCRSFTLAAALEQESPAVAWCGVDDEGATP